MIEFAKALLENDQMQLMGHGQSLGDDNLGLGWLYYSLARIQRGARAVVIGSYRGFVPLLIAKGLIDNNAGGQVLFIDPSYWDGFWTQPEQVRSHFQSFHVDNVHHFQMTNQEFVKTETYRDLSNVNLVFIDGHHTYEQVRFDYEAFEPKLSPDGIVLLHDSMSLSVETYGRMRDFHMTGVTFFVDDLQCRPDLQVFDFPRAQTPAVFCTGLTLVRKKKLGLHDYFRNPEMPGYESLKHGIDLFNQHRTPEAVQHFTEVIELHPSFGAAWLLKGAALCSMGAHTTGIECLERADQLGHLRAAGIIATIKSELNLASSEESRTAGGDIE